MKLKGPQPWLKTTFGVGTFIIALGGIAAFAGVNKRVNELERQPLRTVIVAPTASPTASPSATPKPTRFFVPTRSIIPTKSL